MKNWIFNNLFDDKIGKSSCWSGAKFDVLFSGTCLSYFGKSSCWSGAKFDVLFSGTCLSYFGKSSCWSGAKLIYFRVIAWHISVNRLQINNLISSCLYCLQFVRKDTKIIAKPWRIHLNILSVVKSFLSDVNTKTALNPSFAKFTL